MCVLLHPYVRWLPIHLLEGEAEVDGIVVLTICELKEAEHFKPLMQRVVIYELTTSAYLHVAGLTIISCHK